MKKSLISILLLCVTIFGYTQKNKDVKVYQYSLPNGFSVYLNEDPDANIVFGAVAIKTGGKYDPANATGTSHYLEHMMFKGTKEIGTIDFENESIYLDSIEQMYNELAKTTEDKARKEIQKRINQLSLNAGKFAIPNELDKILDGMGSTMVNAFTSDEVVAYFNAFPSNQMEKWLMLYSHRFQYPVFRLFQSELETVFEEKNMYSDEFSSNLMESFLSNFYKKHPYGTQTVIGTTDHIKNPSLTTMRKMYETYYVANNMSLILTGNFKIEQVKPLIDKYFGELKRGNLPKYPKYKEDPFNGVEKVVEKMSPVKIGVLGYRTVPMSHKESYAFEVCQALLSNSSATGYLDKLMTNGDLMAAACINDARLDLGGMMILYVPKIIGQSFKSAEELVVNEINRLHTEEIDETFFKSVKLELIKTFEQNLEDPTQRAFMMGKCFIMGMSWETLMEYPDYISKLQPSDIKTVAEKYLSENYLSYQSKMGFPKKTKLEKPGFDPIIPKNTEEVSEYAKKIETFKVDRIKPQRIKKESDFMYDEIAEGVKLYYSEVDANDVFNYKIKFKTGVIDNHLYSELAEYLQLIGTEKFSADEFKSELQKYACTFSISADDNNFEVDIDGLNKYFKESVGLVLSLLTNPKADDKKLRQIVDNAVFLRKFEKSSPDDLSQALLEYGMYGDLSSFLRRTTVKDVAKATSDDLLSLLKNLIKTEYSIFYSGNIPYADMKDISANLGLKPQIYNKEYPKVLKAKDYNENTILLLNSPKALQSKISFYINGNQHTPEDIAYMNAFNRYFGTGMSALVFQEIREFRSLAYSAYAVYRQGETFDNKGYFVANVGTQSDKTIEAISVMTGLINNMPLKPNRMPTIKNYLIESLISSKPTKREVCEVYEKWLTQGYKEDPCMLNYKLYEQMDFDGIINFYKKNISGKKILITIVGNKKEIDLNELSKFGTVVEIKTKDILN